MVADVKCPKCGALSAILYGENYRCACGFAGNVQDDKVSNLPPRERVEG